VLPGRVTVTVAPARRQLLVPLSWCDVISAAESPLSWAATLGAPVEEDGSRLEKSWNQAEMVWNRWNVDVSVGRSRTP
jgi:hypothetical protein